MSTPATPSATTQPVGLDLDAHPIAFIGTGSMARAIALGLYRASPAQAGRISCTRRDVAALGDLAALGMVTVGDNGVAIAGADIVVLAVKPQVYGDVLAACRNAFRPGQVLVSVLAGIPTAALERRVPEGVRVVRAMPNTPALIGQGVTGLCAGASAGPTELDLASRLFATVGQVISLDEAQMDALTATSGSGPAYLFYLAELMMAGARELGLPPETADTLVRGTLNGAAALLAQSPYAPETLRARVTSPGGTTARAIDVFEAAGLRLTVARAMAAAERRAAELAHGQ